MRATKALIIDDEESARSALRTILSRHFKEIEIVGEAHNVNSGVELIKSSKFDLLFLDIQMPDGSGFDLLKKLKKRDFQVVFTTAYDNFAIKAFNFSAIGYLLKPISIEEIEKLLNRIETDLNVSSANKNSPIETVLENYKLSSDQINKLVIHTVNGFEVINIDQLVRCEGERNYTKFVLNNGSTFLTSKTLKKYQELLSQKGFLRIHKSHLINLNHVKRFQKGNGGSVEMSDGASLIISREKKETFNKYFIQ